VLVADWAWLRRSQPGADRANRLQLAEATVADVIDRVITRFHRVLRTAIGDEHGLDAVGPAAARWASQCWLAASMSPARLTSAVLRPPVDHRWPQLGRVLRRNGFGYRWRIRRLRQCPGGRRSGESYHRWKTAIGLPAASRSEYLPISDICQHLGRVSADGNLEFAGRRPDDKTLVSCHRTHMSIYSGSLSRVFSISISSAFSFRGTKKGRPRSGP
jgi:hypothetical protein